MSIWKRGLVVCGRGYLVARVRKQFPKEKKAAGRGKAHFNGMCGEAKS